MYVLIYTSIIRIENSTYHQVVRLDKKTLYNEIKVTENYDYIFPRLNIYIYIFHYI